MEWGTDSFQWGTSWWLNVIAYIIIAVLLVKVWLTEHKDIHCPNFQATQSECDQQGGAAFAGTRPQSTDSCETLINKVYKGAGAEQATIKWRRALLLASGIMFATWFLLITPGRLPDFRIMIFSILLGYVILFGSFNYYSYHMYGVSEAWMQQSLDILRAKGCIVPGK